MAIDAFIVFCRFLFDSGALFLWGAALFSGLCAPSTITIDVWTRLTKWRWLASCSVVAGLAATLPLRAASFGDGWQDATSPAVLRAVLLQTNIGAAWMVQAITAILLLVIQAQRPKRSTVLVSALLAGILLASLSLTGHAVMNDGTTGRLHRISNTVHVLAAGAWVGALPAILLVLGKRGSTSRGDALTALMRFSIAGHAFVALVVASGITSSLFILGRVPVAPQSAYQIALAAKISLVLLMIVIALANRYVFVPRMNSDPRMARRLVVGTIAEIVVVPLVIGLVAWFGMIDPQ